jgi:hypothetical protein
MDTGVKEGITPENEKSSKKKKLLVLIIVINIILVSFIVVWYLYLRPWTIRDVGSATNVDIDEDGDFFIGEPEPENPGFSHDLAGRNKIVKGRITDISSYMTTLGPLTYYELDDFDYIHLIEWNYPRYGIGDEIEKKVHFEWGQWNEQKNVYSPQLDFPVMTPAPAIELVMRSVSTLQGVILHASQTDPESPTNVSVLLPMGEGFPLELFNCSLRAGRYSWASDYVDVSGGYLGNPVIDTIPSLSNNTGMNKIVHFSDANHNGLLDDGDYFHFNLTKPEANTAVLTYLFSINGGIRYYQNRVLSGFCYIIMTNRGILRFISSITNEEDMLPYIILNRVSEHETLDGTTTIINITHVIGESPFISNSYCSIFEETWNIQLIPLTNGEILNESGLRIEFSDDNNNGLLDQGDYFIIFGLENRSEHVFSLACETSIGQHRGQARISNIQWLTGIEAFSGDLPIIDFNEPCILGSPENKTYKIEIYRMYGIPGLNLSNENPDNWFRVKIEKDRQEILPPTDLTINFGEIVGEINITFVDADDNEFINTGDYFICTGESPGEFSLTLDYVERYYRYEEGFMVRFSQSVSWAIS